MDRFAHTASNDRFEDAITSYEEGATALKLRLPDGEIDFIVGMSLLGMAPEHTGDTTFALEPVAEVLAKKLFYRGWALTPLDLFDWHAIEHQIPQAVDAVAFGDLLQAKHVQSIESALVAMSQSAKAAQVWADIRAPQLPPLKEAVDRALGQVRVYSHRRSPREASPRPPAPRG